MIFDDEFNKLKLNAVISKYVCLFPSLMSSSSRLKFLEAFCCEKTWSDADAGNRQASSKTRKNFHENLWSAQWPVTRRFGVEVFVMRRFHLLDQQHHVTQSSTLTLSMTHYCLKLPPQWSWDDHGDFSSLSDQIIFANIAKFLHLLILTSHKKVELNFIHNSCRKLNPDQESSRV